VFSKILKRKAWLALKVRPWLFSVLDKSTTLSLISATTLATTNAVSVKNQQQQKGRLF
jgi:hypothetical protein